MSEQRRYRQEREGKAQESLMDMFSCFYEQEHGSCREACSWFFKQFG